jgi:N-acetylglucosaminyldiphosphoundecaprenol N-acetyl-beta-D-mannosaminyltransferase
VAKQGVHELLGVPIDRRCLSELVSAAMGAVGHGGQSFRLACANPHSLVVARSDRPFQLALQSASAVVADGVGCRIGAALAGVPIGPRITGSDFYLSMMSALQASGGGRAFFFGSSESVLASIRERTREDFPAVKVDTLSPPFGEWGATQNAEFIERINSAAPDVLWIAMTAPKQEKWMAANAGALKVPVIACIGAVFEYYAGTVRRAPDWVCDIGLEWMYRLAGEPQRLWRRTLVSAPVFLWAALSHRLARAPAPAKETSSRYAG